MIPTGVFTFTNWQPVIDKIKWDEVHKIVENYLENKEQHETQELKISIIGTYILVAIIILTASYLASKGIVEGQALVGFLGAAIGYLLAGGEMRYK